MIMEYRKANTRGTIRGNLDTGESGGTEPYAEDMAEQMQTFIVSKIKYKSYVMDSKELRLKRGVKLDEIEESLRTLCEGRKKGSCAKC